MININSEKYQKLVDNLFNSKPNEEIIRMLKDEVVIPKDQINNFLKYFINRKEV